MAMTTMEQQPHPLRPGVGPQPAAPRDPAAFDADELPAMLEHFRAKGYAVLQGLFSADELAELRRDMEHWQAELVAGELDPRHGTAILVDHENAAPERFANYVTEVTLLSERAGQAATHPTVVEAVQALLGVDAWLLEDDRFGVVYQDARPGAESGYSRIGWHSDWQSGPHLPVWPSVAFTIHLDATSPANGFLRVLPASHLYGTDTMPTGFEKVPGEAAIYADEGDVIFHDAHLWHSAARATDDPPLGVRRHIRGGYYGGERLDEGHGVEDFVKNAAR
jgi:ectoine hydroxylase-related dioxygenase (phytanoyl-CoA dioxygenase family)